MEAGPLWTLRQLPKLWRPLPEYPSSRTTALAEATATRVLLLQEGQRVQVHALRLHRRGSKAWNQWQCELAASIYCSMLRTSSPLPADDLESVVPQVVRTTRLHPRIRAYAGAGSRGCSTGDKHAACAILLAEVNVSIFEELFRD